MQKLSMLAGMLQQKHRAAANTSRPTYVRLLHRVRTVAYQAEERHAFQCLHKSRDAGTSESRIVFAYTCFSPCFSLSSKRLNTSATGYRAIALPKGCRRR